MNENDFMFKDLKFKEKVFANNPKEYDDVEKIVKSNPKNRYNFNCSIYTYGINVNRNSLKVFNCTNCQMNVCESCMIECHKSHEGKLMPFSENFTCECAKKRHEIDQIDSNTKSDNVSDSRCSMDFFINKILNFNWIFKVSISEVYDVKNKKMLVNNEEIEKEHTYYCAYCYNYCYNSLENESNLEEFDHKEKNNLKQTFTLEENTITIKSNSEEEPNIVKTSTMISIGDRTCQCDKDKNHCNNKEEREITLLKNFIDYSAKNKYNMFNKSKYLSHKHKKYDEEMLKSSNSFNNTNEFALNNKEYRNFQYFNNIEFSIKLISQPKEESKEENKEENYLYDLVENNFFSKLQDVKKKAIESEENLIAEVFKNTNNTTNLESISYKKMIKIFKSLSDYWVYFDSFNIRKEEKTNKGLLFNKKIVDCFDFDFISDLVKNSISGIINDSIEAKSLDSFINYVYTFLFFHRKLIIGNKIPFNTKILNIDDSNISSFHRSLIQFDLNPKCFKELMKFDNIKKDISLYSHILIGENDFESFMVNLYKLIISLIHKIKELQTYSKIIQKSNDNKYSSSDYSLVDSLKLIIKEFLKYNEIMLQYKINDFKDFDIIVKNVYNIINLLKISLPLVLKEVKITTNCEKFVYIGLKRLYDIGFNSQVYTDKINNYTSLHSIGPEDIIFPYFQNEHTLKLIKIFLIVNELEENVLGSTIENIKSAGTYSKKYTDYFLKTNNFNFTIKDKILSIIFQTDDLSYSYMDNLKTISWNLNKYDIYFNDKYDAYLENLELMNNKIFDIYNNPENKSCSIITILGEYKECIFKSDIKINEFLEEESINEGHNNKNENRYSKQIYLLRKGIIYQLMKDFSLIKNLVYFTKKEDNDKVLPEFFECYKHFTRLFLKILYKNPILSEMMFSPSFINIFWNDNEFEDKNDLTEASSDFYSKVLDILQDYQFYINFLEFYDIINIIFKNLQYSTTSKNSRITIFLNFIKKGVERCYVKAKPILMDNIIPHITSFFKNKLISSIPAIIKSNYETITNEFRDFSEIEFYAEILNFVTKINDDSIIYIISKIRTFVNDKLELDMNNNSSINISNIAFTFESFLKVSESNKYDMFRINYMTIFYQKYIEYPFQVNNDFTFKKNFKDCELPHVGYNPITQNIENEGTDKYKENRDLNKFNSVFNILIKEMKNYKSYFKAIYDYYTEKNEKHKILTEQFQCFRSCIVNPCIKAIYQITYFLDLNEIKVDQKYIIYQIIVLFMTCFEYFIVQINKVKGLESKLINFHKYLNIPYKLLEDYRMHSDKNTLNDDILFDRKNENNINNRSHIIFFNKLLRSFEELNTIFNKNAYKCLSKKQDNQDNRDINKINLKQAKGEPEKNVINDKRNENLENKIENVEENKINDEHKEEHKDEQKDEENEEDEDGDEEDQGILNILEEQINRYEDDEEHEDEDKISKNSNPNKNENKDKKLLEIKDKEKVNPDNNDDNNHKEEDNLYDAKIFNDIIGKFNKILLHFFDFPSVSIQEGLFEKESKHIQSKKTHHKLENKTNEENSITLLGQKIKIESNYKYSINKQLMDYIKFFEAKRKEKEYQGNFFVYKFFAKSTSEDTEIIKIQNSKLKSTLFKILISSYDVNQETEDKEKSKTMKRINDKMRGSRTNSMKFTTKKETDLKANLNLLLKGGKKNEEASVHTGISKDSELITEKNIIVLKKINKIFDIDPKFCQDLLTELYTEDKLKNIILETTKLYQYYSQYFLINLNCILPHSSYILKQISTLSDFLKLCCENHNDYYQNLVCIDGIEAYKIPIYLIEYLRKYESFIQIKKPNVFYFGEIKLKYLNFNEFLYGKKEVDFKKLKTEVIAQKKNNKFNNKGFANLLQKENKKVNKVNEEEKSQTKLNKKGYINVINDIKLDHYEKLIEKKVIIFNHHNYYISVLENQYNLLEEIFQGNSRKNNAKLMSFVSDNKNNLTSNSTYFLENYANEINDLNNQEKINLYNNYLKFIILLLEFKGKDFKKQKGKELDEDSKEINNITNIIKKVIDLKLLVKIMCNCYMYLIEKFVNKKVKIMTKIDEDNYDCYKELNFYDSSFSLVKSFIKCYRDNDLKVLGKDLKKDKSNSKLVDEVEFNLLVNSALLIFTLAQNFNQENAIIIMKSFKESSMQAKNSTNLIQEKMLLCKAEMYKFLSKIIKSIEINVSNETHEVDYNNQGEIIINTERRLQREYFIIYNDSLLIESDINEIKEEAPSDYNDRLIYVFNNINRLIQIQNFRKWIFYIDNKWLSFQSNINYHTVLILSFIVVLFINLVLHWTLDIYNSNDLNWAYWVNVGHCAFLAYFIIFYLYFSFLKDNDFSSTIKKKSYFQKIKNLAISTIDFQIFPLIWNFLVGILAIIRSDWYFLYSIQLFSVFVLFQTMRLAVKSLQLRAGSFIAVLILIIILIFFFNSIAFYFFIDLYNEGSENLCHNYIHCFFSHFNFGLRQGGGIGDLDSYGEYNVNWNGQYYWATFIFGYIFFFIMILLMLNIINGIIVDTFQKIREDEIEKLEMKKNNCLICNLERDQFNQKLINFENHQLDNHCFQNYIYYLIKISIVGDNNLNKVELEVLNEMRSSNISFFPIRSSLELNNKSSD